MTRTGRPIEYKKEYVDMVYEYIGRCEESAAEGKVDMPTKEDFACYIGVDKSSLYEWEENYPDFSYALAFLMNKQHKWLIDNGLANKYNPTITKLMLSSNHGYAEKQSTDVTSGGKELKASLVQFIDANSNNTNTD